MKLKITPTIHTKACMTKTEINRMERMNHADRRWFKDVMLVFADKADLTKAQACQLVQSGQFEYAKAIHGRVFMKLQSALPDSKQTERFREYANMDQSNHIEMIRRHFMFALAVRHADDKVSKGAPSREIAPIQLDSHRKHASETKEAHKRRTEAALAVATNPTQENVRELGASFGL